MIENNTNPEDTTPEAGEDKPKRTIAEAFALWFDDNLKSRGNSVEAFFSPDEDEDDTEDTNTNTQENK